MICHATQLERRPRNLGKNWPDNRPPVDQQEAHRLYHLSLSAGEAWPVKLLEIMEDYQIKFVNAVARHVPWQPCGFIDAFGMILRGEIMFVQG